jgi:hypothetical protein
MKKVLLVLFVLFVPLLVFPQSYGSRINKSLQIGINSGFGYNRWDIPEAYIDVEGKSSGPSIVNNLDIIYCANRWRFGVGMGMDVFFFNAYFDNNTTFFPKWYGLAEYMVFDGIFNNGPAFQFGYAHYRNTETQEKKGTLYVNLGWTCEYVMDKWWSIYFKPAFEYKWPRSLVDSGENIYSFNLLVGVRYRMWMQ